MRATKGRLLLCLLIGCNSTSVDLTHRTFQAPAPPSRQLAESELFAIARSTLQDNEQPISITQRSSPTTDDIYIEVVAVNFDDTVRAYVIDGHGDVTSTDVFWRREKLRQTEQFGHLSPRLASLVENSTDDNFTVDIVVPALFTDPQLPIDGRDLSVPIDRYKSWFKANVLAQQNHVEIAKIELRKLLLNHGGEILWDGDSLPIIRAHVPRNLIESEELNSDITVSIDVANDESGVLLGHAGHAAMFEGNLSGGTCGGNCDGGLIDVGIWESDDAAFFSGIARNNARINAPSSTVSYLNTPKSCTIGAVPDDCPDSINEHSCQPAGAGSTNICVVDHTTWVAASVGMVGTYNYNSAIPGVDPIPNVPSGTTLPASGAWKVDFHIGNNGTQPGLDYLLGAAVPYINRSQDLIQPYANWAGRGYNIFMTVASGNLDTANVGCSALKNGLCVGSFSYETYNNQATHRRTSGLSGSQGSSYINSATDSTLERPHLLGPGFHSGSNSGLHMPAIDVSAGSSTMRNADYSNHPIFGTSFAAPAILGAAILAHQYEGWFSSLAFPVVNKSVLLASTVDANADGNVGKGNVWFPQSSDAEDGAGQLNFTWIKKILDNNTYTYIDLSDSDFSSCGTNCREVSIASVYIPADASFRAAMAWQ